MRRAQQRVRRSRLGPEDLPLLIREQVEAIITKWADLSTSEKKKAVRVAASLLCSLREGAKGVTILTPEVVTRATELSGRYMKYPDRLVRWPYNGQHEQTNGCAVLCGDEAKQLAGNGATEVTADQFEEAWKHVKGRHSMVIKRLKRLSGTVTIMGLGCG